MLNELSNEELTSTLKSLAAEERRALVSLLEHLAEFDERTLYSDLGYPSLFAYCVSELHYSEQATAKRVYTARAVRKYPMILEMLRKTELHMSVVMILGPHLTQENHLELLGHVRGRSRREAEAFVASLAPSREVAECIRRVGIAGAPLPFVAAVSADPLPMPAEAPRQPAALEHRVPRVDPPAPYPGASKQTIEFLSAQRVHFGFNGSDVLLAKYERARELLRHKYPAGKLEDILSDALEALLEKKDPDRWTAARPMSHERARSDNRHVPRFVKSEVWARDAGRCVFRGPEGTLCGERGGLEFDHITPFAFGGRSDDPKNIRLLCRTHNQLAARRIFGEENGRASVKHSPGNA